MTRIVASLLVFVAAVLLSWTTVPVTAQTPTAVPQALRAGIDKEVLGDLRAAIVEYQRVFDQNSSSNRALAAQALLRMAGCYQLLGDKQAVMLYERISNEFGDQKEAADARARLASLPPPSPPPSPAAGIYLATYDPTTGRVSAPSRFPSSADSNCAPAWSPDGRFIAFKRRGPEENGQRPLVWVVRSLATGQEQTYPNNGTYCWVAPVWAHDSRSLLNGTFVEGGGRIFRIDLGTLKAIDLNIPSQKPAVALSADDKTLFLTAHDLAAKRTSIVAVDLASGAQRQIWTSTGDVDPNIRVPLRLALSPDGRTFALVLSDASKANLVRVGVDGSGYRVLHSAEGPGAAGSGVSRSGLAWTKDGRHVLFMDGSTAGTQRLMRIAADGGTPEFTGLSIGSVDVVFDLSPDGTRLAIYSTSAPVIAAASNSASARQPSGPDSNLRRFQLTWLDRSGRVLDVVGPPALPRWVDLAPDGRRVAAQLFDDTGGSQIWIGESAPGTTLRPLTSAAAASVDNRAPIWSPDGTRIAFASFRNGRYGIYARTLDGTGGDELLVEAPLSGNLLHTPMTWSPDGRFIVYQIGDSSARNDLWVLPLTGERKPLFFSGGSYQPQISPNGRWIAYSANGAAGREIHIRPFPQGTGDWKVADGGNMPRWRSDGRELYFYDGKRVMVSEITVSSSAIKSGPPRALFTEPIEVAAGKDPARGFVAAADGQRFLVSRPVVPAPASR